MIKTNKKIAHILGSAPLHLLIALALGCLGALSASANPGNKLSGAGATFPQPIYSKWFFEMAKDAGAPQVNYQAIGSGGGVRQLLEGTVDFGASDEVLKDTEEAKVPGGVLHLPTVLGAVVVTYNLPSVKNPLRFSADTISKIYRGEIKNWNHEQIKNENPKESLPALPITAVFRSDGSGTTAIFTDFLTQQSKEFASQIGQGKSVAWTAGVGAKGNAGVAGLVSQTAGALGYVELVFALSNKLPTAEIQNSSGAFVLPSATSLKAAAGATMQNAAQQNFKINIVNASDKAAYPIAGLTWLLIPKQVKDPVKTQLLARMAQWVSSEKAQKMAQELNYAPLPASLLTEVRKAAAALDTRVLAR